MVPENCAVTNTPPVCSVCIAHFNGRDLLKACLDSVLQQQADFPIEIIVHDDASTDGSLEEVQQQYPSVRFLVSPVNVGFCVSNNRMVDVARGTFLLLLNNDAELYPDALQTLYDYAQQQSTMGILGLPQYHRETGRLIDVGSFLDPFLNPLPNLEQRSQPVGMIIGACLWLPQTLWQTLGGFPVWFDTLAEDMFLCCHARLRGYPVEAVAVSGFRHWVGKSLGGGAVTHNRLQTTLKRRALSERNKTFVMILCYPAAWIFWILPLHLLLLVAEGLLLSLVKRDLRVWTGIYWHCLKEIWCKRQYLCENRQAVQRTRQVSARTFFAQNRWIPHKLRMLRRHGWPTIR